jgi:glycosyltransferase 2 family protein
VLLLAVALGSYALASQWGDIHRALARVGVLAPLLSFAAAVLGLGASALSWQALMVEFGERLPWPAALRVFYVGQLGKYLPGGVWPVLAQMELGHAAGARRRGVGAAALVVLGVNVTTGMLVAVACLPFTSSHALHRSAWVLALLPVGIVLLHPRVLRALINVVLRLLRQEEIAQPLRWRGVLLATSWSLVMWFWYGVHLAVLAHPLAEPGHHLLLLSTGAYALAWVVGFLVVIAPAGVGAREAMLVVALSPVMPASAATAVALLSRFVMTAADFACAGVAAVIGRRPIRPDVRGSRANRS